MTLPAAEPGGFLGLDLARRSGWAYAPVGGDPVGGEMEYPPASEWGRMITAHAQMIWALIDAYSPAVIAYEAPLRIATDHENNIRTAWGLSAETEATAFQAGTECLSATPGEIRKAVLNDGKLTRDTAKATVQRWTLERGWNTAGHNQADALLVLCWAMKSKGCRPRGHRWDGHRFWRADALV